jgi:hypothetical protein
MELSPGHQEKGKTPLRNLHHNGAYSNTNGYDDELQDEVLWLYSPLLGHEVVNGKPLFLVPWNPTWEPSDDY